MTDAEAEIREIMSVLLERDIGPADSVTREQEPLWDSLHHVELLLAIEGSIGVRFDQDELPHLDSLEKIIGSVRRHQGE
jgi:acyl carrier protein